MAHIHPSGWREMSITGTAAREIETLSYLDAQLADAPYSIYHGVHWTNVEQGFSAYGEIDFIIVAPSGRVLLIEQKSGFLTETPDGLVKSYQGKPRKIRNQILRTIEGLVKRFGSDLSIDYLHTGRANYRRRGTALGLVKPGSANAQHTAATRDRNGLVMQISSDGGLSTYRGVRAN